MVIIGMGHLTVTFQIYSSFYSPESLRVRVGNSLEGSDDRVSRISDLSNLPSEP